MSTKLPYTSISGTVVLKSTIDFKSAPKVGGVTVPVLDVPAGTLVLRAGYTVITPEGGTAAGTLGDGADVDGYIAAVNLNSAAGTKAISALALTEGTPNTVAGYSNGKFYTAADTIDLVLAQNDMDTAVVEFWAICVQP
jgi:large exoprotein involved in heme utilization and adhesion